MTNSCRLAGRTPSPWLRHQFHTASVSHLTCVGSTGTGKDQRLTGLAATLAGLRLGQPMGILPVPPLGRDFRAAELARYNGVLQLRRDDLGPLAFWAHTLKAQQGSYDCGDEVWIHALSLSARTCFLSSSYVSEQWAVHRFDLRGDVPSLGRGLRRQLA